MIRVALNRLAIALVTIVGASMFIFVLLRVLPGDPARLVAGQQATPATLHSVEQSMGLDQSIPAQYWHYVSAFLHGDLGYSYSSGQPVGELLSSRLPATIELGMLAFFFAVVMAVAAAGFATYRRKRGADVAMRAASSLAMGAPPFWLALVVILLLSQKLGIFPGLEGRISEGTAPPPDYTGFYSLDALLAGQLGTFFNVLWHLMLPAFVIAVGPFGFLSRLLRSQLRSVQREPYMVVARGKGLRRRTAFLRHAMPNAMLVMLPALALLFAELLAGSVLVEAVFAWPGIGTTLVNAILKKDYAVVQAVVLLSAVAYVLVTAIADIVYAAIDPRIRTADEA